MQYKIFNKTGSTKRITVGGIGINILTKKWTSFMNLTTGEYNSFDADNDLKVQPKSVMYLRTMDGELF